MRTHGVETKTLLYCDVGQCVAPALLSLCCAPLQPTNLCYITHLFTEAAPCCSSNSVTHTCANSKLCTSL